MTLAEQTAPAADPSRNASGGEEAPEQRGPRPGTSEQLWCWVRACPTLPPLLLTLGSELLSHQAPRAPGRLSDLRGP